MAKWDNMLTIVWLLRSRKSITASEMAEKLETSVRTIYRYIDSLCASGVPIVSESGHEGGYYLLESFREAPLFFELDELKSMFHAASFAQGLNYPYETELNKALDKIQHRLNGKQQDYIERHTSGFDVISAQNESVAFLLQQVEKAVAESRTLDVFYDKRRGAGPDKRRIDPYALIYKENNWYIIAYCHLRQALRTFRIDRVTFLTPTEHFFKRPREFSVREYVDRQWYQRWRALEMREPTVNVHLQGNTEMVDYLCHYFNHCLMERNDYEAYFKISAERVSNMLPEFLVSFGKCIQVLEPESLRIAMAEVANGLEKYYRLNELH